jgi:hypothetical protein
MALALLETRTGCFIEEEAMRSHLSTWALAAALAFSPGCAPLLIGGAAAGGAAGGVSSAKASEQSDHSAGTYAGTVLANVVYFPAKALFAGGGAVTSGVAYLVTLGNRDTARSIWDASVEGDYVVTPNMIEGRDPVHFVGS